MNFLEDIIQEIGCEYAQIATDLKEGENYVDTGSYIFNALVSGSIFGGFSSNKITTISGASSTGKCARGSEKIIIYCDEETADKIKKMI
jgi:hypothetical protein